MAPGSTTSADATKAGTDQGTEAMTLVTAAALADEQSARARASLRMNFWITLVAGAALQLTVVKTTTHWVLTGVIGMHAALSLAFLLEAGRVARLPSSRMPIIAAVGTATTLAAIARLGVLSPVPIVLSVIIYYHSLSDSPTDGLVAWIAAAAGYLGLVVLSYVGVLPLTDSVLALARQNDRALVGFAIVLESVFFGTYWIARLSRRATHLAISRLEAARLQIHQRDALLLEARADLDRVLDGAKLGRFTGRDVGAFTLGHVIGRGTMGEVYEATRPNGDRAAVKVLHTYLLQERALLERFFREAEISSSLESRHVVRVLGKGQADDGTPYLAMELLEGDDLASRLRDRRKLGLPAMLDMVAQVAEGLSAAQDAGIVHRDLKPQNLVSTGTGARPTWKILDFGVAALVEGSSDLTQGAAVGTPNYMAPEQARGEAVDHRADVFSLGTIAYRALTGQPAFAGADSASTLYRVLHVQPTRPSELVTVHEDVDLALALAVAKDRSKRFRSATTFAAALRDAARGELDEPYRVAAREILARHGWGKDDAD